MRIFLNAAASFIASAGAIMYLVTWFGQAVTGGVRNEPSAGGPLDPITAIHILLWLSCVAYVSVGCLIRAGKTLVKDAS